MAKFQDIWAVNWQDGMLVNAEHLTLDQQYVENIARRIIRSTVIDYGLAWDPTEPDPMTSLDWEPRMIDENVLEVEVRSCRAVTPDGSFIAIFNNAGPESPEYTTRIELTEHANTRFNVFIEVDHSRYHEVGLVDSDEIPPRALYRINAYHVTITGTKQKKPNALKIGEVILRDGKPEKGKMIPASLSMRCDKKQVEAATLFKERLEKLGQYAALFYEKLMNNQAPTGAFDPGTQLAAALARLSAHITIIIAESFDRYVDSIMIGSPRNFVIYFKEFFRRLNVMLNAQGKEIAQEIYNMWGRECDGQFKQYPFEEKMRQLLETPFDPELVFNFIYLINFLLDMLSKVYLILLSRPWGAWSENPEPTTRSPWLWDVIPGKQRPKTDYRPAPPIQK